MPSPKEMEKRLLAMQEKYAKAPADRQPQIREEYRALHRQWVASKSQLTLGSAA